MRNIVLMAKINDTPFITASLTTFAAGIRIAFFRRHTNVESGRGGNGGE